MPRRVSLPGADELFRPTDRSRASDETDGAASRASPEARPPVIPTRSPTDCDRPATGRACDRRSSGRVRHDEKMTVYVTADELLDLEHARLALRRDHGSRSTAAGWYARRCRSCSPTSPSGATDAWSWCADWRTAR